MRQRMTRLVVLGLAAILLAACALFAVARA